MLPVVAIVGRPNVGKSTLFNCMTRTRQALVADEPGLTRDRQYALAHLASRQCVLVDTGGLIDDNIAINAMIGRQARAAIDEADIVMLVVDSRDGLTPADHDIARELRATGKPVVLTANKIDGADPHVAQAEFSQLGFSDLQIVSAAHGRGIPALSEHLAALFPAVEENASQETPHAGIKVAIAGRPNVGKSTLINRLCGEQRVVAHDMPGTTRDCVHVPLSRGGQDYVLIDTAGMRRKARIQERVERFSIIKTLQAIDEADVVIVLLDASEGITDQDSTLLGHVIDAGRALVIGINKWDGLDPGQREQVKTGLSRKLRFIDYAKMHFVSALHGSGVGALFRSVTPAYAAAMRDMPTPLLTRILEDAVARQPPPLVRGRRIKLRYAHQGGSRPPRIVIHGNQTDDLPKAYRRYLARHYRQALDLQGTPVEIELRTSDNPFKGKRNTLTRRQREKRQRMMRHVKKS